MSLNPYTVLGVDKDADAKIIKSAYRRMSASTHPDKEGGSDAKFREVSLAYEVLGDPVRRERYDKLGRTDASKVTPARVKTFIKETMKTVIEASRPDGSTDDPTRENIKDKMRLGILGARVSLQQEVHQTKRKLERAERLAERFETSADFDPVGEALIEERDRLTEQLHKAEDALELSHEVERVLNGYSYKVDPWGGGTFHPQGPTTRSTTGSVLIGIGHRTRPSYMED